MQTREIQSITKGLNRLRLVRESFNKDFDNKEARLLNRLAEITGVDLEGDNGTDIESVSIPSSVPELESIHTAIARIETERVLSSDPTPPAILSFDTRVAYTQVPVQPSYRPILSPRDVQVGDRVRITNRLSHVKGRSSLPEDAVGTVTKVNLVHIRLITDSGIETSRIKKNLEREVTQQ